MRLALFVQMDQVIIYSWLENLAFFLTVLELICLIDSCVPQAKLIANNLVAYSSPNHTNQAVPCAKEMEVYFLSNFTRPVEIAKKIIDLTMERVLVFKR